MDLLMMVAAFVDVVGYVFLSLGANEMRMKGGEKEKEKEEKEI
jgi:hypothetical protein